MKPLIHRIGGKVSSWLLARPSNRSVGQANIRVAFGICAMIGLISIAFVLAQWAISERLYFLQKSRNIAMASNLSLTQEMATRLSNAHRSTLNVLLSSDSKELEEAMKKRAENLEAYHRLLERQSCEEYAELRLLKETLFAQFQQYSLLSQQVLDLMKRNSIEEARSFRIVSLRPVYDKWQATQDQFNIEVNSIDSIEQARYLEVLSGTRLMLLLLLIIPTSLVFFGLVAIVAVIGWQHRDALVEDPHDTWAR